MRFLRGCGSVGRASPCQGEGRGFESRHPLANGNPSFSCVARWVGREARQRPAKPYTRVRVPYPPRAIGAGVARFLHTEEVTGSIPVSPTTQVFGVGPQRGRRFVVSARGPGSAWGSAPRGRRPPGAGALRGRSSSRRAHGRARSVRAAGPPGRASIDGSTRCAPRLRDRSGAALPLGRSSSAASDRMLSTSIQ